MAKYLFVEGDHNDADYVAKLEKISDVQVKKYLPLIQAISKNNGEWDRSWDGGQSPEERYEKFGENLVENFRGSFVPYGPDGASIHTLNQVMLLETTNVKNLI